MKKSMRDRLQLLALAHQESHRLLTTLSQMANPLRDALIAVSNGKDISVSNATEGEKWISAIEVYMRNISRQISPQTNIPILFQAVSDFYFGPWEKTPSWIGMPLKHALELVAGNNYLEPSSSEDATSIEDIVEVVKGAILLFQLQAYNIILQIFGTEEDYYILSLKGFKASPRIETMRQRHHSVKTHADMFRTTKDTLSLLFPDKEDPFSGLKVLTQLLKGAPPYRISALKGTIFYHFTSKEPPQFWAALWIRWYLALTLGIVTKSRPNPELSLPHSISIFGPFPAYGPKGTDEQLVTASTKMMFWERDWYFKRIKEKPGNLINERPILRVTNDPVLYVTSYSLLCDSISSFVEAAMFKDPEAGAATLSHETFQRCVSTLFEAEIINLFRQFGYIAGEVTKKGAWKNQIKIVVLKNTTGEKCPGQIDVLAWDRNTNQVIVADAKVLRLPYNLKQFRSYYKKIKLDDKQGFHTTLKDKILWLQGTDFFSSVPKENFEGAIILDRQLPKVNMEGYPVIDRDSLEEFLKT